MPYLVHLNIELPRGYGRELDQLPLAPARHLRIFELRRHGRGAIPALLFAAIAPVLHSVAFHWMVLPDEAILAFARVRRLRIAYEDLFPPTNLARCFPSLRSLQLHYVLPSAALSPDCARRTLAGLHLDELTVGESWQREMRMIGNVLPLQDIPLVRQHGFAYDLGESRWQTQTGPLSVRARAAAPGVAAGERPIEILVVPDDGAWHRVFLLETWDDIERGVLCAWPPFPAHMEYLRLDGQFLADFLRAHATYAALRRIHIDLRRGTGHSVLPSRGGGTGTDPRVLCPVLEEVVICALDTPRMSLLHKLNNGVRQRSNTFAPGFVPVHSEPSGKPPRNVSVFAKAFWNASSICDSRVRSLRRIQRANGDAFRRGVGYDGEICVPRPGVRARYRAAELQALWKALPPGVSLPLPSLHTLRVEVSHGTSVCSARHLDNGTHIDTPALASVTVLISTWNLRPSTTPILAVVAPIVRAFRARFREHRPLHGRRQGHRSGISRPVAGVGEILDYSE